MAMRSWSRLLMCALALSLAPAFTEYVLAQEASAEVPPDAEGELDQLEARLAERYDRLELLVARLAELSGSTQPRRATLLRQLVSQSRDRDVAGQFDKVIASLEKGSYSSAIDGQAALQADLQKLLDLLLQEDRDRQIESERKRIGRYLQDVNRLIRLQRGVKARTDGGDDEKELAEDQREVGDKTKSLGDEIAEAEETAEEKAQRENAEGSPSEPNAEAEAGDEKPQQGGAKPREKEDGKKDNPGDESSKESKGESSKPESSESDKESKPSESGESKESQPAQGSPSESQPSPGGESQEQQPPPESTPMQRAAERLKQAQQRMEQAKQRLEESKRDGAAEEQAKAVEELEQAKAELERILRQLREEELERMLVMLEARIRKMLDQQIEVYEETKQLDAAAAKAPEHELEIASGRLARKEGLIVREADRALVLLREDGTSVAFPEAIEQARDDMQSVADRLRQTKVDLITQGLEEDVIAALEESLAALQQALEELRENKGQPQPGESAPPGEKPLVDQLAELRMIRALQVRVNRRTEQYGAMIEGEQAQETELLEALDALSLRQQKIFQATRDLGTKEN
jgi:hypothetical protein